MQTTVRVTERTHMLLKELASRERSSMQVVLEMAVEDYRRRRFLESINEGYAALQADPAAWEEAKAERELWDLTLADGLPAGDTWEEPAGAPARRARTPRAKSARIAKPRRKP